MTTVEGNKLIALFDGMEIGRLRGWLTGERGEMAYRKVDGQIIEAFSFDKLKYHTSWDWLMPVVEKIFNTTDTMNVYLLYVCDSLRTANIETVYDSVIQFIQWYSLQSKK